MSAQIYLVLLIPILGMAQLCYFPPPVSLSKSCQVLASSDICLQCNNGYQLLQGACYPNCPSGWIQLMPGYCVNQTVVNQHEDFALCPTNETMKSGSSFSCYTPANSNCNCGPPCPQGYLSQYCQCIYEGNINAKQIKNQNNVLGYIFGITGIILLGVGITYVLLKGYKKYAIKKPEFQIQISQKISEPLIV